MELLKLIKEIRDLIVLALKRQNSGRYLSPTSQAVRRDSVIAVEGYAVMVINGGDTVALVDDVVLFPNSSRTFATSSERKIKHKFNIKFDYAYPPAVATPENPLVVIQWLMDSNDFENTHLNQI